MKNVWAYEGKQQGVLEGRLREKWGINSNTVMLEKGIERKLSILGLIADCRRHIKEN